MIEIGGKKIGDGHPCYVIAEIGINHNGDLPTALGLMTAAADAGCDAVKFQKRTIELCYTKDELDKPRESPWGTTTMQQKEGLELGDGEYDEIDRYAKRLGIQWFASCWDAESVKFVEQFNTPCFKIHSAALTDRELITRTCQTGKPILLSTGMSTLREIDLAVQLIQWIGNPLVLMHCTSTYPAKTEELNLACIPMLKEGVAEYLREIPVGYSGHEVGLATTLAAVVMGACVIERHITLDRTMYGSDQSASVEPHGFKQLVRDIREFEKARGDGIKRVYDSELPIRAKLRKVSTLA